MTNDQLGHYYASLNYPLPDWQKKLLAQDAFDRLRANEELLRKLAQSTDEVTQ